MQGGTARLRVNNIEVLYKNSIRTLHGVSFEVGSGEMVAMLGPNGAGKTSCLRSASGQLSLHDARLVSGRVELGDQRIDLMRPSRAVAAGIAHVLEGRHVFGELSVLDNLRAGAHLVPRSKRGGLDRVFDLFPALAPLSGRPAGYLSGGEQQMLVIGRALMGQPRFLLLDEPTLGLAPKLVETVLGAARQLTADGLGVLLVEQNARAALAVSDRAYVLESGRIVMEGRSEDLRGDADIQEYYLGVDSGGARRSYRERRRTPSGTKRGGR